LARASVLIVFWRGDFFSFADGAVFLLFAIEYLMD